MNFKVSIKCVIAAGCLLGVIGNLSADDDLVIPDTRPGSKPGDRPKIPSKNQFSFYVEGDCLIIESSSRELAEISIIDAINGATVFRTSSYIYPDYRCDISGLSGTFNLVVSIGDVTTSVIICL